MWTVSCCWGGWLVLVRGGCSCHTVNGCLLSGAALVSVRLDVGPLLPSSSLPTVAGCLLGGFPAGRDLWGGESVVGGVIPHIDIGTDVWGESGIMTGVYERWCSSALHIGWGLCDCLCLVLVCRGRYCLGGGVLLFILGSSLVGVGPVRGLRGGGRGGWCEVMMMSFICSFRNKNESGPGAARTILLFHTINARPPKQPRMVRTFLKVHTRPRLTYALQCRGY